MRVPPQLPPPVGRSVSPPEKWRLSGGGPSFNDCDDAATDQPWILCAFRPSRQGNAGQRRHRHRQVGCARATYEGEAERATRRGRSRGTASARQGRSAPHIDHGRAAEGDDREFQPEDNVRWRTPAGVIDVGSRSIEACGSAAYPPNRLARDQEGTAEISAPRWMTAAGSGSQRRAPTPSDLLSVAIEYRRQW
jgi:hypothetical protein